MDMLQRIFLLLIFFFSGAGALIAQDQDSIAAKVKNAQAYDGYF